VAEAATPVWLLAAPFSGVCWLAGVLGRHPQLYATPQLHLSLADRVDALLELFDTSQGDHGDGLLRCVADLVCGGESPAQLLAARDWLNSRGTLSTAELLRELAQLAAPRRLVIPEAEAALRPYELLRLQRLAPQAPVVQLLRHPWTQGCLMADWFRERLFVPIDYRDYSQDPPRIEPQIPWLRANLNLDRQAGHTATYRLRGETLDRDFDEAVRALCSWLQLPLDAATLAAMADPGGWRFAGPAPDEAPGGLEPDVTAERGPQLEALIAEPAMERALPWRNDGSGFAPEVMQLAERYGY
jgi:hypothetical protein